MYHNAAATCDRHLAKHLRDVMGNASSKNIKINRVDKRPDGDDLHFCSCGKIADFHLIADRGGRNGQ